MAVQGRRGEGDIVRAVSNKDTALIVGQSNAVTFAGEDMTQCDIMDVGPLHIDAVTCGAIHMIGVARLADIGELAELLGTITYEITCAVSDRVPRIHRTGEGGGAASPESGRE